MNLKTVFRANTPQLYVDIDRTKCKTMGVPLSDVFDALQVEMGGLYVNDFNQFGRTFQVNAQADIPFRMSPDDLRRLYVRNRNGGMVPLATVANVEDRGGPFVINRYNMHPAAAVNGASAPGMSSGETIAAVATAGRREPFLLDGLRVDGTDVPATDRRQHHRPSSSAAPWCWCSWCWPASTRAGRCRWP